MRLSYMRVSSRMDVFTRFKLLSPVRVRVRVKPGTHQAFGPRRLFFRRVESASGNRFILIGCSAGEPVREKGAERTCYLAVGCWASAWCVPGFTLVKRVISVTKHIYWSVCRWPAYQGLYLTLICDPGARKQHKYICSNIKQYIVWVKIIHFSVMPKIIRILRSCSMMWIYQNLIFD